MNGSLYWRGSGVDSVDITATFYCDNCDKEQERDGTTNDERTEAYATCRCGREMVYDIPETEPEFETDDYLD